MTVAPRKWHPIRTQRDGYTIVVDNLPPHISTTQLYSALAAAAHLSTTRVGVRSPAYTRMHRPIPSERKLSTHRYEWSESSGSRFQPNDCSVTKRCLLACVRAYLRGAHARMHECTHAPQTYAQKCARTRTRTHTSTGARAGACAHVRMFECAKNHTTKKINVSNWETPSVSGDYRASFWPPMPPRGTWPALVFGTMQACFIRSRRHSG